MIRIEAAQHVVGNVEKEDSPSGIGGFQTLYCTRSRIDEGVARELERWYVYYASDEKPDKYLFFALGEKFVVSRIAYSDKKDTFGRSGLYLVHSVLVDVPSMQKIGFNPFAILDLYHDRFLSTFDEARERGRPDGFIPAEIFEFNEKDLASLEESALRKAREWDREQLLSFLHIALHAQEMREKKESVAIAGSSRQIADALSMLHPFLPPALVADCSFDTHLYKAYPSPKYFWAMGFPTVPPELSRKPWVDADHRHVRQATAYPLSPYEVWLRDAVLSDRFAEIARLRTAIYAVTRFLDGQDIDASDLQAIDDASLRQLFSKNQDAFGKRMRIFLHRQDPALSDGRIDLLLACTHTNPERLFHTYVTGRDSSRTAFEIARKIAENRGKITDCDTIQLELLRARCSDGFVQVLFLSVKGDFSGMARHIPALSGEEYQRVLEALLPRVPARFLVDPSRIPIFLDAFHQAAAGSQDVRAQSVDAARILWETGRAALIERLKPYLEERVAVWRSRYWKAGGDFPSPADREDAVFLMEQAIVTDFRLELLVFLWRKDYPGLRDRMRQLGDADAREAFDVLLGTVPLPYLLDREKLPRYTERYVVRAIHDPALRERAAVYLAHVLFEKGPTEEYAKVLPVLEARAGDIVSNFLASPDVSPTQAEMEEVGFLVETVLLDIPVLVFLHGYWAKKPAVWRARMQRLDDQDYRTVLRDILAPATAEYLVDEARIGIYIDAVLEQYTDSVLKGAKPDPALQDAVVDLTKQTAVWRESEHCNRVVPLLQELDARKIQKLKSIVTQSPGTCPDCIRILDRILDAKTSPLNRLLGRFGR